MSFLKNLLKDATRSVERGARNAVSDGVNRGIRNAVSGAVEKAMNPVAEKWANKAADNLDQAAGNAETTARETNGAFANLRRAAENYASAVEKASGQTGTSAGSYASGTRYVDDGIPAETKIRNVLAQSFPQYEVRENVSPATIGGTGRFMNYSFGIYAGGRPVLFIMMIGKTTCSTRMYRWSKEQAARSGVTMINFIRHYPNNVDYITERLRKYL